MTKRNLLSSAVLLLSGLGLWAAHAPNAMAANPSEVVNSMANGTVGSGNL